MAGTRSRRTQTNASPESTNEASDNHNNRDVKARSSRNSRIPSLTIPDDDNSIKNVEKSSTEIDSSVTTTNPTTSEEVSSNTSDSGSTAGASSEKSSSETSVTSDETLKKSKEELIRIAHDLDAQMQELIKIYKDEKKIFVEKSIHLLDNESHPDWLQKIEELRQRRDDSIKTANERHRLRVESILAEYDFALKNVSDEFQAAEKEIIDEFTSKRKRKTTKDHDDFTGLMRIERAALGSSSKENSSDKPHSSSFTLDQAQIQNDLSAINKMIETSVKTMPSSLGNENKIQTTEMAM